MLRIENLNCGYGLSFMLKDINLQIKAKEVIGIIGPNGSGKTTLLRSISRILKPEKGSILFENRDIWQTQAKELAKKVAVVSQVNEGGFISVEEFVLLGRIPHFEGLRFLETKKDIEIARRCMELTDTLRLKDKLMAQMSGGERQLAIIAKALAQEPRLLLLDEPTTHLDITHQIAILDLIKRLNKNLGLTVLMVMHDLNLASEYCNRLVLLSEGEVYKEGVPHDVLTYQIIEKVYNAVVVVEENPLSKRPYVLAVSQEQREKKKV